MTKGARPTGGVEEGAAEVDHAEAGGRRNGRQRKASAAFAAR